MDDVGEPSDEGGNGRRGVGDAQRGVELGAPDDERDARGETDDHRVGDEADILAEAQRAEAAMRQLMGVDVTEFDLDASAFLLDSSGKVPDESYFVFYNNPSSPDGAVTTSKILNAAVDTAKLASDAVITAKILDQAVTTAKIADSA